jgi:histidyl-tRNA synthetase
LNENVPAVGFSIGFERIFSILMEHGIDVEGRKKKVAVMYDEQDFIAAVKVADKLRSEGNIASLYVKPKKMGKFLSKLEERKYDGFVNVTNGEDVSWF